MATPGVLLCVKTVRAWERLFKFSSFLPTVEWVTRDCLLWASQWVARCQDLDDGSGGVGGPGCFCFVFNR